MSRFNVIEKAVSSNSNTKENMHDPELSPSTLDLIIKDHEEFEVLRVQATEEID